MKPNKKIEDIFYYLRDEEGVIKESRRIKPKNTKRGFKASFLNRILYNPKLDLDEEEIAYALLHEEGHKETTQNTPIYFAIVCVLAIAFTIPYLLSTLFGVGVPSIGPSWTYLIIFGIIVVVFTRAYSDRFHEDELRADVYACKRLKKAERFSRPPEEIMADLLERGGELGGVLGFLFGGVFHPSDEERVEWVRQQIYNHNKD